MDTVGGKQIGRMRIELPGRYEENVVPIGFLREQGLQVDVVDRRPPSRRPPSADPPLVEGRCQVTWSEMQPLLQPGHVRHPLHGRLVHAHRRRRRPAARRAARPHRQGGLLQNTPLNKVVGADREHRPLAAVHHPDGRADALHPLVVGTTIGPEAAIVPLAIGAIPFFARLVETAVREVDHGLVEAVQAMGGGTWTIVRKVLLPAGPALARSPPSPPPSIALIGYSAMAGAVGGGGLGIQGRHLRLPALRDPVDVDHRRRS